MAEVSNTSILSLEELKKAYPEKFVPENDVFGHIKPGAHIFVGHRLRRTSIPDKTVDGLCRKKS